MLLNEIDADQGVSLALKTLLEEGFKSKYWDDYKHFITDWNGEEFNEEDYELDSYSAAWQALEYIEAEKWFPVDATELMASISVHPVRSSTGDHDEYYAILALTDGFYTRYFKRLGHYSSYDGGDLQEPNNYEVHPEQVITIEWKNV